MILASQNYSEKLAYDFNAWDEWVCAINSDFKYCKENIKLIHPKHIKPHELPSYHPYWLYKSIQGSLKYYSSEVRKCNECIINPDKTKYLFNATADVYSIKKTSLFKIKELKQAIM